MDGSAFRYVSLDGKFAGLDVFTNVAASDVHILLNSSTSLFSGGLNGLGTEVAFGITRILNVGDKLEFAVGRGPNTFHNDSTGMKVRITADPPNPVLIDIKPGSYPNSIHLGSNGTVPVAIFSSATFDARTINPASVTLAGAAVKLKGNGSPMATHQDVNGDGFVDLVIHVNTEALQLSETDTEAVLDGLTSGGVWIRGKDSIRVVP